MNHVPKEHEWIAVFLATLFFFGMFMWGCAAYMETYGAVK